jgi:proteic killer suppression protein
LFVGPIPKITAVRSLALDVILKKLYRLDMIISFACRDTENIFCGRSCRRWGGIRNIIERKLQMLDAAASLAALRSPPGNKLEALVGDRAGQHSIRINKQWRICFIWSDAGIQNVEIIDYH